jgi:hypothetical protein
MPHGHRLSGRITDRPRSSPPSDPSEALEHLGRIAELCDALQRAQPIANLEAVHDALSRVDGDHWIFTKYLSLPLYQETLALLRQAGSSLASPPRIAVVMAVHRPDPGLLRQSLASLFSQVGVGVQPLLSLDGPEGGLEVVESVLAELGEGSEAVELVVGATNQGVGLCRNAALRRIQADWFTFLDCDDIFHPLRCLHAWLALRALEVQRLNTGYSRVSLRQRKILLLQQSLTAVGGNSFLACSGLLASHGYLAPLRFYEDSEYQNRLAHFGVPMAACAAVAHYQNSEAHASHRSLASRRRREQHAIEGHPYLCGTVIGAIDAETEAIRDHYNALYARLEPDGVAAAFPPA